MKVEEIVKAINGKLICGDINKECKEFKRDSREIEKDDVYIALIGDNSDGNDYYQEAVNKGAALCVLSRYDNADTKDTAIILVDDTLKALQDIARYERTIMSKPIVAVTGSAGKTSTKDLIASVLGSKFKVLKTKGNYNNHIGMPLSLLSYKNEDMAVIEMGMSDFGEISILSNIAKPNVAVITNIGTAHIGNLGSREGILKAKLEILDGLQDNVVIINNDDDMLSKWAIENQDNYSIITCGIENKESMYVAENIELYEDCSYYTVNGVKFEVPVGGKHFILNSLLAYAVAKYYKLSDEEICNGLKNLDLTSGRMQKINLKNGTILINDCYNANFDSMKAAIKYIEDIKNKRRILVLGDMLELGEYSEKIHSDIGELISDDIDILITTGEEAKNIDKFANAKEKYWFENNEEVIKMLKNIITENDIVLLKASNGMNFKEICEALV